MINNPGELAREMCDEWPWLKAEQRDAIEERIREMNPYIQVGIGIVCAMATRFAVQNSMLIAPGIKVKDPA